MVVAVASAAAATAAVAKVRLQTYPACFFFLVEMFFFVLQGYRRGGRRNQKGR